MTSVGSAALGGDGAADSIHWCGSHNGCDGNVERITGDAPRQLLSEPG